MTHAAEGLIFTPKHAPYNLGGFESEGEPTLFKFVADPSMGLMGGLDGSITETQLLHYIKNIPASSSSLAKPSVERHRFP